MAEIISSATFEKSTSTAPGLPAPNHGPTWPTSIYDGLLISADGRRVGECDTPEITRRLEALKIAGFKHENGRLANLEMYAATYQKIAEADGRNGILKWLQGNT